MRRIASLALALLLTPTGFAADFDARVARAEARIATPEGHAYDMALVPAIHAATTRCVPAGRAPARAADAFTAVASVAPDGRVGDVQVRPQTPLSQCFARQLAATRLQPPPRHAAGSGGHPILIRVRDAF